MRLLIADDHPIVRGGVRRVLESRSGNVVCGEAENGADAVQLVSQANPDVLILGLTMPVLDGLDAAREILRRRPPFPIVILSTHESGAQIDAAKRGGVKGYVSKTDGVEDLIRATNAVASGQTYFPPSCRPGEKAEVGLRQQGLPRQKRRQKEKPGCLP